MIHFLTTERHANTVTDYLATWGEDIAGRFDLVPYEQLAGRTHLARGTYIFADLERLTPAQTELAMDVYEQLEAAGPGVRMLNHPRRTRRRYDLLQALFARGINHFRAYRATEPLAAVRLPAFLRFENEHTGSLGQLVHSPRALEQAVRDAIRGRHHRLVDLLVLEYLDTADEAGLYRKYAAFNIAGQIIPRQVLFSRNWVVKIPDLVTPELAMEEMAYLHANPHEEELRRIFELARVDYGRIDYSIHEGRVQVWEINTNPTVLARPEKFKPASLPAQQYFADRIGEAFAALDAAIPSGPPIAVHIRRAPTGEVAEGWLLRMRRRLKAARMLSPLRPVLALATRAAASLAVRAARKKHVRV